MTTSDFLQELSHFLSFDYIVVVTAALLFAGAVSMNIGVLFTDSEHFFFVNFNYKNQSLKIVRERKIFALS